jgi:hypothetical protein
MSWKYLDTDRWEWTADEELHLLLLSGTQMRELHVTADGGVFVHIYEPDDLHDGMSLMLAETAPEDMAAPLAEMTHVRTWSDDRLSKTDTDRDSYGAWFTWLEEEGYVQE